MTSVRKSHRDQRGSRHPGQKDRTKTNDDNGARGRAQGSAKQAKVAESGLKGHILPHISSSVRRAQGKRDARQARARVVSRAKR